MQGVELRGSSDSADHVATTSDIESTQHIGLTCASLTIGKLVNNDQYLKSCSYLNGVFMNCVCVCTICV